MFWSWTAIAILALTIALLTGRSGPLLVGAGAALASALDHYGLPLPLQWLAGLAGVIIILGLTWVRRRR